MRHNRKINHLGRQSSHRKALLANMATSLIVYKRIETTVAKAKTLKKYVEPIITKSKNDTTHSRRTAFSYLKDKKATAELFREVAPRIADRPGGYTRILKTGFRLGDGAEMCIIELVDFNQTYVKSAATETKGRTRRGRTRRGAAPKESPAAETVSEAEPCADGVTESEPKAAAPAPKKTAKKPAKAAAPAEESPVKSDKAE